MTFFSRAYINILYHIFMIINFISFVLLFFDIGTFEYYNMLIMMFLMSGLYTLLYQNYLLRGKNEKSI